MENLPFLSPALILIILILLTLTVYWVVSFITLYHLVRFGIGTQPKKIAATFLFGLVGLFFLSVFLFASIDMEKTGAGLARIAGQIFSKNYLQ